MRLADTVVLGAVDGTGDPFFLQTAAVDPASPVAWISGEDWRSARFSAAQIADGTADWEADPDGDGRTNLAEMGLGSDPRVADEDPGPVVRVTSFSTLELSVAKALNHRVEYVVEVSDGLVNWRGRDRRAHRLGQSIGGAGSNVAHRPVSAFPPIERGLDPGTARPLLHQRRNWRARDARDRSVSDAEA